MECLFSAIGCKVQLDKKDFPDHIIRAHSADLEKLVQDRESLKKAKGEYNKMLEDQKLISGNITKDKEKLILEKAEQMKANKAAIELLEKEKEKTRGLQQLNKDVVSTIAKYEQEKTQLKSEVQQKQNEFEFSQGLVRQRGNYSHKFQKKAKL